jgi:hypothetical protein
MIQNRVKLGDINPEALQKLYDAIETELQKRKEPVAAGPSERK